MREIECYLDTHPSDPMFSTDYRRLDMAILNGYVPQSINLGFPEVRHNADKRPLADGEDDFTEFTGASAVSLKVAISSEQMAFPVSDQKLEDNIRRWLHPRRRSRLCYRRLGEDNWRYSPIRGSQGSRELQLARTKFGEITATWRNWTGFSFDLELSKVPLSFGGSESGRTYDLTFDRNYPASGILGIQGVFNAGNVEVSPVVHIYGPISDFRLDNLTTGETLKFKSTFALVDGEFLVVDMDAGTVLMGGDITNSRYNQIDIPNSTWWRLREGLNQLRPIAASYTAPAAHLDVFWQNAYI